MLSTFKNTQTSYSNTKSNLYQLSFSYDNSNNYYSRVFELPYGMTENEMYIVLSYILDNIKNIIEINLGVFIKIDALLEKIGFFTQDYTKNEDINILKIDKNFEKNKWYKPNTNINQINSIYNRINYVYNITENDLNTIKKTLKKWNLWYNVYESRCQMKFKNINRKKIKQIACTTLIITSLVSAEVLAKEYQVKRGDTLSKISLKAYGTIEYYDELAFYNEIVDPNFIKTGWTIEVPPLQKLLNYIYDEIYIVKKGDTLSKICKEKYGSSKYIDAVTLYNDIENKNLIRTNQTLFLPNTNKLKKLMYNNQTNIYHTIKNGETLDYLSKIYYKTNIFATYLKEYNCLESNYLTPNTKIFIPTIEDMIEFYNSCNEVKYVR